MVGRWLFRSLMFAVVLLIALILWIAGGWMPGGWDD